MSITIPPLTELGSTSDLGGINLKCTSGSPPIRLLNYTRRETLSHLPRRTPSSSILTFARALQHTTSVEVVGITQIIDDYRQGIISLGRAAEKAGLKYDAMIDALIRRGVELDFGPTTIEEADAEMSRFLE